MHPSVTVAVGDQEVAFRRQREVGGVVERRPGSADGPVVLADGAGVGLLAAPAEGQEELSFRGEPADGVVLVVRQVEGVVGADGDPMRAGEGPLAPGAQELAVVVEDLNEPGAAEIA